MNRNVKRLLIGRFMSFMGDGIFAIAVPLYLLSLTNSLFNVGLFFMLIRIPSMILTPHIGVIVEKINKKKIIVVADILSGFLFTILSILMFYDIHNLILFAVISAVYQVIGNAFKISSSVLFTLITNDDERLKLNGHKGILDNITSLSSPAIGAVIYSLLGMKWVVTINAISFIASAIFETGIDNCNEKNTENKKERLSLKDYKDILNWLRFNTEAFGLLAIIMILNFFVAPNEEVIFPGIVLLKYNINDSYYGISTTFFVIGSLLASITITKSMKIKKIQLRTLFILDSGLLVFIGFISKILYSYPSTIFYSIYLVIMLAVGGVTTFINIPLMTEFQTKVPTKMQGRFFATLSLASALLIPLGILFAGLVSEMIGPDTAIMLNNLVVILFAVKFIKKNKRVVNSENKNEVEDYQH